MIQGKWIAPGMDASSAGAIRQAVLNLSTDDYDALSWNVVVSSDDIPCATGRIRYHEGVFLIEHLCVLPDYRANGIGDLLTRLLLYKARRHSARWVKLHCSPSLFPFFKRFGFTLNEDGWMVLAGPDILQESCQGCAECAMNNNCNL